jgi:ferredoxin
MNTKLIYFSPTNTTKKVVSEIARGIGNPSFEINLTKPQLRNEKINLEKSDLAVIGVPVYGGRVPKAVREVLVNNFSGGKYAIIVAVYGNRAYDDALAELKDLMNKKGLIVIGAIAAIGEHSYSEKVATNRPDKYDLDKLFKFGEQIRIKINQNDYSEVSVKGEVPTGEAKISSNYSVTNQKCTECGICVTVCPMEAISKEDPSSDAIKDRCIMCCACIKACPENAREPKKDISEFIKRLETEIATGRKKIEKFI